MTRGPGDAPDPGDTALVRGNGVGLEVAGNVIRGVRLGASRPGTLLHAAEVSIAADGEVATLDALVRMWAELGEPTVPTRLACFPVGSLLRRRDVTGLTGPELTSIRSDLERRQGINSTVLVERGARRWLLEISWNETFVRQLERLAERAGFIDVSVDPAPLALARALPTATRFVRRDAGVGVSFEYVSEEGVPLAGSTTDPVGRQPPDLGVSTVSVPSGWFEPIDDATSIRRELQRLRDDASPTAPSVRIGDEPAADHPPADLRSPIRQCVAIGAAAAAAGLVGRVHPVDITSSAVVDDVEARPWAIERVSDLPVVERPTFGTGKRLLARFLPRRR